MLAHADAYMFAHADAYISLRRTRRVNHFTCAGSSSGGPVRIEGPHRVWHAAEQCNCGAYRCNAAVRVTDKRKFWWSEMSKWHDRGQEGWIQWIELVAGLSAMIVLTWSLMAVWDGK
jgi:hypothetical protein